jgi:hypothetical protein
LSSVRSLKIPPQGAFVTVREVRLFQNFSFGNSFLRFNRKTGPDFKSDLAGFSKRLSKTNRVLEQAQVLLYIYVISINFIREAVPKLQF